jgi:hypothetical protein
LTVLSAIKAINMHLPIQKATPWRLIDINLSENLVLKHGTILRKLHLRLSVRQFGIGSNNGFEAHCEAVFIVPKGLVGDCILYGS